MLEKMEKEFNTEEIIEEFEAVTKDAERVQRETLKKILTENGGTEYLQKWGLNGKTDPESYTSCVPLVTHADLEPYIHRIADGDSSPILTGKPLTAITLSSGTTQGKPKFVPFNDELMASTLQIYLTSFAFRNREFPINGKALQFIYSSKQFKTKGGITAGTATTNVFRNSNFKKTMKSMQSSSCSPDDVIFGPDFHQSLYCHLLCGLIFHDEVQLISSTFAHSLVHAFRTFEDVWEELVTDIRTGVLSSRVTALSVRNSMSKILKPNPELADTIFEKCSSLKNWYCLIPAIFPNIRYVYGIMTGGSMELYVNKLRHYAGKVPLVCADYGASEGWIGANVNPKLPPETATFAVLPNIGFFEFIPLNESAGDHEKDKTEPKPLGLTQVKVGKEYEIIITSLAGLYRYRLGDVVKVMGFHNKTPELQFVRRHNLVLAINIDKNTEKDLQISVETAAKLLSDEKHELVDYTSMVDFSTDPAHYVIFWEVNGQPTEDILQQCSSCLDKSFVDAGYVSSRKVNSIGPLELRVLKPGTFHKIIDHYVGQGSTLSQFKTPRCVGPKNATVLQILSNNVVRSYFSTAF
jgi:jasmonic acid-amino synthetase